MEGCLSRVMRLLQRIRAFTTVRYINRLFTYLLTYLLTYFDLDWDWDWDW